MFRILSSAGFTARTLLLAARFPAETITGKLRDVTGARPSEELRRHFWGRPGCNIELSENSMPRTLTAGMVFLALPALVAAAAPGESTNRTRVTIRGTGSNVAIERTESLPRETAPGAPASGPLEEAIALKAGGANDTVVIAYLRERQNELPSVIAAQDMKRLRRAGAGRSVAAFLATAAAVGIGESGEGYEATASAPC